MPTNAFYFYMTLLRLQKAGYTIDNNKLSLHEWMELGDLKDLVENHKESARLKQVSMEMSAAMTLSQFGKKRNV